MTTSSTTSSSSGLSSLLDGLTSSSAAAASTSTSGPLITTGQINVSQLVSELMTIQEQPLVQLQSQEAGVQSTLSAYGQVQSALSSLQTAADALALPSAFQQASASVTGSGVSASVSGSPSSANYSVSVTSLAQAQSDASTVQSSATATLTDGAGNAAAGTLTITQGSNVINVSVDSSNDTLDGIASAINAAANGAVNAGVVTNANGSAQLVIASSNTGAANSFTVSGTDTTGTALSALASGMTQTQPAADAAYKINGLALTSASNTVTSAINGVTLSLTQAGSTSQVQVGTDSSAVAGTVNNFISAYNAVISLTNSLTNYNPTLNKASILTGDQATQSVVQTLQSVLGGQWNTSGSGPSWLAQVGVSTNSDGTLSLNTTQFQAALAANPTGVQNMFMNATGTGSQQGFAVQVENTVQQLISNNGALGAAEQNLNSQVTYMNQQQATMQAELTQMQASLTQEYSALNAEVSQAQAEQTSLAGELASLPG